MLCPICPFNAPLLLARILLNINSYFVNHSMNFCIPIIIGIIYFSSNSLTISSMLLLSSFPFMKQILSYTNRFVNKIYSADNKKPGCQVFNVFNVVSAECEARSSVYEITCKNINILYETNSIFNRRIRHFI